jgi:hypothetical protein
MALAVIPEKAGIQFFQPGMDSGFRRSDGNCVLYASINFRSLVTLVTLESTFARPYRVYPWLEYENESFDGSGPILIRHTAPERE